MGHICKKISADETFCMYTTPCHAFFKMMMKIELNKFPENMFHFLQNNFICILPEISFIAKQHFWIMKKLLSRMIMYAEKVKKYSVMKRDKVSTLYGFCLGKLHQVHSDTLSL